MSDRKVSLFAALRFLSFDTARIFPVELTGPPRPPVYPQQRTSSVPVGRPQAEVRVLRDARLQKEVRIRLDQRIHRNVQRVYPLAATLYVFVSGMLPF